MSFRTITVASTTKSTAKQYQSEATTWGGFKDFLRADFDNLDKMRAVIRETRNDLTSDDAILPLDSFTILLNPKEIKAGASQVDVIGVLESVKERFGEAIDDIIEDVQNGHYDQAPTKLKAATTSVVSSSLAKDLEGLKNGKF